MQDEAYGLADASTGGVIRNTAIGAFRDILAARIINPLLEALVQKLTLAVAMATLITLGACKKTGEGEYEVQKPVVGTETDTVHTPSVETGTVKDTINVPTVETKKKEVTLPKVEVKKPNE